MIIDTRGIDGANVALGQLNKKAAAIITKGIRAEASNVATIAKEKVPADPLSKWALYSWVEQDRTTDQRNLQWNQAEVKASVGVSVRNKAMRKYKGITLNQRTDARVFSKSAPGMIYQTAGNGESKHPFVRNIRNYNGKVNDRFLYGARNSATFAQSQANINALLASASAQVQRMLNKMEGE